MDAQNVTVSLPRDVLLRVKVIAAQRRTSVSSLLTDALEQLVAREDAFVRGRRHHLAALEAPADLGTNGVIHATRDELHARG
ncbi:MAG: CopG family transcriptional regulator [Ardenticatenales bacterium]|nr:CopG family transcriptional regulator [Ardenticatenales bacterium]